MHVLRLTLTAVLLVSGCRSDERQAASAAPQRSETSSEGDVAVTVTAGTGRLPLSERLKVTIAIGSPSGIELRPLDFADSWGDFQIAEVRDALPRQADGGIVREKTLTLVPQRAGRTVLEPIPIAFRRSDAREGAWHYVETRPLPIEVTTVVGQEPAELSRLEEPRAPIELPRSAAWKWLAAAGTLVAAGIAFWWWRRVRPSSTVSATPSQIAERELSQLWNSRLAERDVKGFYVELTAIVRRFIERTTPIDAPDLTTEEFLQAALSSRSFGEDERARLRDFLESADLVKFAAHRPTLADIRASFDRAGHFVRRTATELAA